MDAENSTVLLKGILETLKSINTGLQDQDKKWQWLQERLGDSKGPDKLNDSEASIEGVVPVSEKEMQRKVDIPLEGYFEQFAVSFVEIDKLPALGEALGDTISIQPDENIGETPVENVASPTHLSLEGSNFNDIDSLEQIEKTGAWRIESTAPMTSLPTGPIFSDVSLKQIEDSNAWLIESKSKKVSLIDYRDWKTPLADSPLYRNPIVSKELGDAWMIPEDGRLSLLFSREYLETLDESGLKKQVSLLAAFRDKMKTDAFVDFKIVDEYRSAEINRKGGRMIYRLGEPIKSKGRMRIPVLSDQTETPSPHSFFPAGPALRQDRSAVIPNGPWRRYIFCQGLNTARFVYDDFGFSEKNDKPNRNAPFLSGDYESLNWWLYFSNLDSYMRCKRIDSSFNSRGIENHYMELKHGFHITFFEILPSYMSSHPKFKERGTWKHGPLYNGSEDFRLCESAFTLIGIPGGNWDYTPSKPSESWTIMILSPPGFTSRFSSTPISLDGPMHGIIINSLVHVFRGVRKRWDALRDHLKHLLDEGDALFNPQGHDKLLWDDENFTRSRKYFWAINCLTEFHQSISDNIKQWENYHAARIEPLRKANALDEWDIRGIRGLGDEVTALKNLRLWFEDKLTSTKALRDGLFNASAVIESRASTRLGENVKLLTLVSIFFLPLAFCTSLWSINNMFSTTTLIYTIIAVGITTYLIVFNLNNLVLQAAKFYQSFREQLIKSMKNTMSGNEAGFWAFKGERFDVFKPRHEKAHPSEWWILIFLFRLVGVKIIKLLHLQWPKIEEAAKDSSSDSISLNSSHSSVRSWSTLDSYRRTSIAGDPASETDIHELNSPERREEPVDLQDRPEAQKRSDIIGSPELNKIVETSSTIASDKGPTLEMKKGPTIPTNTQVSSSTVAVTPGSQRRNTATKALSKLFKRKAKKKVSIQDSEIV